MSNVNSMENDLVSSNRQSKSIAIAIDKVSQLGKLKAEPNNWDS